MMSHAHQKYWPIFLWLLVATLALLLSVQILRASPCWLVPVPIAFLAYPIWIRLRESFLFRRRLMLAGATVENSQVRRWFWNGQYGSILLAGLALISGMVLVLFAISFSLVYWIILFADTALIAALYLGFRRMAATQIQEESVGIIVRVWPLWLANMIVLSVLFFTADFFITGATDWRYAAWHEVVEQGFVSSSQLVSCSWLGVLAGIFGVIEQSKWALAQQVIPNLSGLEWRVFAWVVILSTWGLFSYLMTSYMMGVLALIEQRKIRSEFLFGKNTLTKTYVITILFLAIPYILVSQKIATLDFEKISTATLEKMIGVDPCVSYQKEVENLHQGLGTKVSIQRQATLTQAHQAIDEHIDSLFGDIEFAVDAFLDSYYTITGEYLRLGYAAFGDFDKYLEKQVEEFLFDNTNFSDRLMAIDHSITKQSIAGMESLVQGMRFQFEQESDENACFSSTIDLGLVDDLLRRDQLRAGVSGSAGALTGISSKKIAAATLTKIMSKKSFQAAVVAVGKVIGKKAGGTVLAAITSTAICAPAGPLAIACGVVAGGATWLVVDKIALEIDEKYSREAFRKDIMSSLTEQKEEIVSLLKQHQETIVLGMANKVQEQLDTIFVPARDGI